MERDLKQLEPPSSEITPKELYLNRRQFMKLAGLVGGAAALAACGVSPTIGSGPTITPGGPNPVPGWGNAVPTPGPKTPDDATGQTSDELGDPLNKLDDITNYNNYYEFSTSKDGVAPLSQKFQTSPWQVEVGGLVHNPKTFAIEDLLKFQQK